MSFYILAGQANETNVALVSAARRLGLNSRLVAPGRARARLRRGDVAVGRVDVLPTLDGVESCLWELRRLERTGAQMLNGIGALLAAHDKLATAVRLARAGLRHPRTLHVDGRSEPSLEPPLVLKPRFGSWGRDVVLCETHADVARALRRLRRRAWFPKHGALAQELVPPTGYDLRLLVAGGRVVGAVERHAAPGEWRTNVALGGTRHSTVPDAAACAAAVAAARAIDGDLVGVDLLPASDGSWLVLELNGAVEFNRQYSLDGGDVFEDVVLTLVPDLLPVPSPQAR